MDLTRKTPTLKTVEKALDIFDCILDAGEPMTASAIAELAGLSLSSTYKFLSTLVEKKYLFFDPDTKQYSISGHMLRVTQHFRSNQRLTQMALPMMRELAAETKETIHLAIPQGIDVVFVEKIASAHTLTVQTKIGSVNRMDKGATPQVIMAFSSEKKFVRLCDVVKHEAGEDSVHQLIELRQRIRENGFATSVGQMNEGIAAIAVPVLDSPEHVVAAVAVAAPQVRHTDGMMQFLPALSEVAFKLSKAVGYPYDNMPWKQLQ